MATKTHFVMTPKEWKAEVGSMEDISDELPDSFLMFGQIMRAKVRYKGKVYYASAWSNGKDAWVDMVEQ